MDTTIVTTFNDLCRSLYAFELFGLFFSSRIVGFAVLLLFVVLLIWRLKPGWAVFLLMALVVGFMDGFNHHVLKAIISRPRPCHVLDSLYLPAVCGTGWSMPSNHAANAFAAATLATVLYPRIASICYSIAICIALSRVVLGVHYLSDVMVGALVGSLVGLAAGFPARRWLRRRNAPRPIQ